MIGRLVQKADFERALATPVQSRSVHFAVHHVAAGPTPPHRPASAPVCSNLSTAPAPICPQAVDDTVCGHWIGCVVPKRHARRAVTRSLLKRQIRGVFGQHAGLLPAGQWLVRLRQPFAQAEFVSASSEALRRAARDELDGLLVRAGAAGPRR
jgi:ribonuclease P protein component